MKNLFKKVHYGALTFVFALALILTQSAFTTKFETPNYYLNSQGEWESLNGKTYGSSPGQYSCDDTDVQDVCSAYFESPNPEPETTPTSDIILGEIQFH